MNLPALDKGGATLLAAALAALISLVSLTVSIISARAQSRLSARLTNWTNLSKEGRDYKLKQLTAFYDPIYALLNANKRIFEKIGPTSSLRQDGKFDDAETAEVWRKLSDEVIVVNNERICSIIESNLHYIADGDDESLYLDFVTHAHAYKVFKQQAYEAYGLFKYPKGILVAVESARKDLRWGVGEAYKSQDN